MESRKFEADRVIKAVAASAQQARREHKQAGRPIAVEKDGKVVIIPPEEIELSQFIQS